MWWQKILRRKFFTLEEEAQIMSAIQLAESACAGEIRVFVESRCKQKIDARTWHIFKYLRMQRTQLRNGVLIYVAMRDRQFAIMGDEGINRHTGNPFWSAQVATMKRHFEQAEFVEGICAAVGEVGEVLAEHYPHRGEKTNELPDRPRYGR
jgi:uncharacterized membrane protein